MLSLLIFCYFILWEFLCSRLFIIHRQNYRADWKLCPHEWLWSMSSYGDETATWLSQAVYLEALFLWNFKLSRKNWRVRADSSVCLTAGTLETGLGNRVEGQGISSSVAWISIFFSPAPLPHSTHICAPRLKSYWLDLFGDSTHSLSLGMVKRSSDSDPGGSTVTQGSISSVYIPEAIFLLHCLCLVPSELRGRSDSCFQSTLIFFIHLTLPLP